MHIPNLQARLYLAAFLFAVLFKFWLVWETEIADAVDDPHEYVLQILYPVNGGLAYPPGTGLVGRLFHASGIPFRLGIEAVFLAASALVVRALFDWPWKSPLALGLFVFAILDPTVDDLFSRLGSDEVWLVETMLGAATFVLAWRDESKPSWLLMALSAFFFGLSTITRSVFVPLELALDAFAAISIILIRAKRRHPEAGISLARFGLGLWTLVLGIFLIYGGTCTYNARSHGYHGISVIDSNEYKNFYLSLESVGDPSGQRYFSIDHDRRNLIAEAGPTSKWLMNELDHNEYYKNIGLERYGTLDVPSGWFEFAVFNSALPAVHGDLRQCFALFAAIEQEIADAKRSGTLKVHSIVPLPDNRISIVTAEFPSALHRALSQILYVPPSDSFAARNEKKRYDDSDFNQALSRRTVVESPVRDRIWQFLDVVYPALYAPAMLYLLLAFLVVFEVMIVFRWYGIPRFPMAFLSQQFFMILFVTLILWYALFDASGRPVVSRYMILNHVLLVPLICYYLSATMRLVGKDYDL